MKILIQYSYARANIDTARINEIPVGFSFSDFHTVIIPILFITRTDNENNDSDDARNNNDNYNYEETMIRLIISINNDTSNN